MLRRLARVGLGRGRRRKTAAAGRAATDAYVDSLGASEFSGLAASVGRRLQKEHPIQAQAIAKEADLDMNGVVTREELAAWWKRRAPTLLAVSAAAATGPPSRTQLFRLGVVAAVPCFTFGFLDNAIMLVAGEAIEVSLGVKFGLSSMARRAASPTRRKAGAR